MGWIADHQWETWLIVALACVALEMLTLDFTLIMVASGAAVGAVLAAIGVPPAVQIIAALIVAAGMLYFVRPSLVRKLHRGPTIATTPESLAGDVGLVLERVTPFDGRVKLRGEVWSARTADDSVTVEPGKRVVVDTVDGATAVVHPAD